MPKPNLLPLLNGTVLVPFCSSRLITPKQLSWVGIWALTGHYKRQIWLCFGSLSGCILSESADIQAFSLYPEDSFKQLGWFSDAVPPFMACSIKTWKIRFFFPQLLFYVHYICQWLRWWSGQINEISGLAMEGPKDQDVTVVFSASPVSVLRAGRVQ